MTTGRPTNLALAALLIAALLSGFWSFAVGTGWGLHPSVLHGAMGLAILVLSPWKSVIVRRGIAKSRPGRTTSVFLVVTVLIAICSGLAHSANFARSLGGLSIMQIHVGGAFLSMVLTVVHYRRRPQRLVKVSLDRRGFLRLVGFSSMASFLWLGWEGLAGAGRRFTGSHERGSFDPSALPVTSWINDRPPEIKLALLRLADRTLSYDELEPLEEVVATLDCTGGWYSQQRWEGVRLDRLLEAGDWRSIEVRSSTGYARRFPVADLDRLWLATSMGGEPLTIGHGFPARLVAPDRRGFWWVKWVVSIEGSMTPSWVQSPFPLT